MGRVAPFGESHVQFVAVGLVPAITYMYMSRFIMYSVNNNRPLLNFAIVKLCSTSSWPGSYLEILAACCVAGLIAMVLFMASTSPSCRRMLWPLRGLPCNACCSGSVSVPSTGSSF